MPNQTLPLRVASVQGVDVSHHQGIIDWSTVAGAGTLFAFAKATEGDSFVDSQFVANWAGMKSAGIMRGAYHFFHPAKPAKAQADKFLEVVNALEPGDLPPALDIEETPGHNEWNDLLKDDRVNVAVDWLNQIGQALGVRPFLYTRRGFVKKYLGDPGPLASFPLWIAHYTNSSQPTVPAGWDQWTLWQYSESGTVEGIAGSVDLDDFNGSFGDLQGLAQQ